MNEEEVTKICKEAVKGKARIGMLTHIPNGPSKRFRFCFLESGGDQQTSKNLSKDLRKRIRNSKQEAVV